MQIIEFIVSNAPWAWIVAGLILLALETVVPGGGVLVWMGISGIITGLMVLFQDISWPLQWLSFGVLSLLSVTVWLRWSRTREKQSDRPYLNRRADQLVGRTATLAEPISQGVGRISIGDTIWRVVGPDLPAGTRVRVVAARGGELEVAAE